MNNPPLNPEAGAALGRLRADPRQADTGVFPWLDAHRDDALILYAGLGLTAAAREMGIPLGSLDSWRRNRGIPRLTPGDRPPPVPADEPPAPPPRGPPAPPADQRRGKGRGGKRLQPTPGSLGLSTTIAVMVQGPPGSVAYALHQLADLAQRLQEPVDRPPRAGLHLSRE